MEHRCSVRVNTELKILIYKMAPVAIGRMTPVAIGRIRNGSKVGFFIETDFADVNILQPLDVEILLQRGPKNIVRHRYTTRVIRKTESGLGLELEFMSDESAKALDELLRSPQKQPIQQLGLIDDTQDALAAIQPKQRPKFVQAK